MGSDFAELARVEETLEALSLAVERVAHSLVPAGEPFEPVGRRFERAAAAWPATYGREGPSYERQAQLLCSLYEASATLRLSRRACARANELLIDMTVPVDGHRPSMPHAVSSAHGVPPA